MADKYLLRLGGGTLAASGLVCPCHVLTGAVLWVSALFVGQAPTLDPGVQEGIHTLYLPSAVITGAWLLSKSARHRHAS